MEITSGGTGGPRPDDSLHEIGLWIYATLPATCVSSKIAESLVDRGWSARKSGWNAYEVAKTWVELELDGGANLLSGRVLADRVDDLLRVLDEFAPGLWGEVYDRDRKLLRTFGPGE